ncbi:hypothetical protein FSST1_012699 [Fusarium sambucinum]
MSDIGIPPSGHWPFGPTDVAQVIQPMIQNALQIELFTFQKTLMEELQLGIAESITHHMSALKDCIDERLPQVPLAGQTLKDAPDYLKIFLEAEDNASKFDNDGPYLIVKVNNIRSGKIIRTEYERLRVKLGLSKSCELLPFHYKVLVREFTTNLWVTNTGDLKKVIKGLKLPEGVEGTLSNHILLLETTEIETALKLCRTPIKLLGIEFDCVPFPAQGNPLFCYRCWMAGHFQKHCGASSFRCGKCAGNHSILQCKADFFLCCNCGGDHGAWDFKCTFSPSQREHESSKLHRKLGPDWASLVDTETTPNDGSYSRGSARTNIFNAHFTTTFISTIGFGNTFCASFNVIVDTTFIATFISTIGFGNTISASFGTNPAPIFFHAVFGIIIDTNVTTISIPTISPIFLSIINTDFITDLVETTSKRPRPTHNQGKAASTRKIEGIVFDVVASADADPADPATTDTAMTDTDMDDTDITDTAMADIPMTDTASTTCVLSGPAPTDLAPTGPSVTNVPPAESATTDTIPNKGDRETSNVGLAVADQQTAHRNNPTTDKKKSKKKKGKNKSTASNITPSSSAPTATVKDTIDTPEPTDIHQSITEVASFCKALRAVFNHCENESSEKYDNERNKNTGKNNSKNNSNQKGKAVASGKNSDSGSKGKAMAQEKSDNNSKKGKAAVPDKNGGKGKKGKAAVPDKNGGKGKKGKAVLQEENHDCHMADSDNKGEAVEPDKSGDAESHTASNTKKGKAVAQGKNGKNGKKNGKGKAVAQDGKGNDANHAVDDNNKDSMGESSCNSDQSVAKTSGDTRDAIGSEARGAEVVVRPLQLNQDPTTSQNETHQEFNSVMGGSQVPTGVPSEHASTPQSPVGKHPLALRSLETGGNPPADFSKKESSPSRPTKDQVQQLDRDNECLPQPGNGSLRRKPEAQLSPSRVSKKKRSEEDEVFEAASDEHAGISNSRQV